MQLFHRIGRAHLFVLLILLSACGQDNSVPGNPTGVPGQPVVPTPTPNGDANGTTPAPGTNPVPTSSPTPGAYAVGYNEDVAPIFQSQCQSCHGGSGLMDTYSESKSNFSNLISRINSGNMPKGRPALSQATKNLLNTWATEGFPQTR